MKLDVLCASFLRVAARQVEHFRRHVDAYGLARRSDFFRRKEYVQAAAATQIDDRFPLAQGGEGGGVPAR